MISNAILIRLSTEFLPVQMKAVISESIQSPTSVFFVLVLCSAQDGGFVSFTLGAKLPTENLLFRTGEASSSGESNMGGTSRDRWDVDGK